MLEQWQQQHPTSEIYASSRKPFEHRGVHTFICDFSNASGVSTALQKIIEVQPQRIFYISGGGPYGKFAEKEWKDHQWALQVSFLSPAQLIHECLQKSQISQFVCVGSSIAEARPDTFAASYAAAKHALKGLISSLQGEITVDLRLFSPGYMQTEMLPPSVQDRLRDQKIQSPNIVAKKFIDWAQNPSAPWHHSL